MDVFYRAVRWGMVRCEWKHWPNQPEPVSPESVDLLVSGFPSCSLETGCQSLHNANTHMHDPHMSSRWGGCSHSFHLDCNLYLHHILLPPKQEISLLFCLSGPYYSLSQLHTTSTGWISRERNWNMSSWKWEKKRMNCAIFTSQALSWQSSWEDFTISEQIESQGFCSRSRLQDTWLLMDTLVVTASTRPLTFCWREVSLTTSPAHNPFLSLFMHLLDAPIQNDWQWVSREVQYLSYWQFDEIPCPFDGCILGMERFRPATFQFLLFPNLLFSLSLKVP